MIFVSRSPAALAQMVTAAELDCRAMMGRATTAGVRAGHQHQGAGFLTVVSQAGGTTPDSGVRVGHLVDSDLRIRIPVYWLDPPRRGR